MNNNKKRILIVAAHPDDEVLGCGGTIAKLASEKKAVYTIILGEGCTSRFKNRKQGAKSGELKKLKASVCKAADVMGVKKTFLFDFPDNRFDSVPLLDIIKTIENIKGEIRPEIIYTHHGGDLNIDHGITLSAVLTAFRPIKGEIAREIYSFETLSSTEWNYPNSFSPNVFNDISGTIDKKIKALNCYKTEVRQFPHPRSEEGVRQLALNRGSMSGLNYAEAFEAVRIIR